MNSVCYPFGFWGIYSHRLDREASETPSGGAARHFFSGFVLFKEGGRFGSPWVDGSALQQVKKLKNLKLKNQSKIHLRP